MNKRNWKKDKSGLTTVVLAVVLILILVIAALGVVVAWNYVNGDNSSVYVPPDERDFPIIGYVSASVVVEVDNSALFGGTYIRLSDGSLSAELQSVPTGGAEIFKIFDIWSHDVSGTVKFQLTNPGFNYDTGKQKATFSTNVGGGELKTITVEWPNGPAVRHHGIYSLSAFVYDAGGNLLDSISKSVDL